MLKNPSISLSIRQFFYRIRSKHEIMLNNEARPNPQLQLSLLTSESLINRINSDEMLIGRRENLDNEGLISISTGQPRLQCDDRIAKNIDNFVHSVQNLAQSRGQMVREKNAVLYNTFIMEK